MVKLVGGEMPPLVDDKVKIIHPPNEQLLHGGLFFVCPEGFLFDTKKATHPPDRKEMEEIDVANRPIPSSAGVTEQINRLYHQWVKPMTTSATTSATTADTSATTTDHQRVSLTHLPVISLDPPGCEDVDDAFSVVTHDHEWYTMYVHITDVTSQLVPHSKAFYRAAQMGQTIYVPGYPSQPLFPTESMSLTSGKPQRALTVSVVYHRPSRTTLRSSSQVQWTWVGNPKDRRLSYDDVHAYHQEEWFAVLSEWAQSGCVWSPIPSMEVGRTLEGVVFPPYDPLVTHALHIISQLAVFTNQVLSSWLPAVDGFFRSCARNAPAQYGSRVSAHAPLQLSRYTHATSPLRRFADCIVHYLLRHPTLFTHHELSDLATYLTQISRDQRTFQRKAIWWGYLQWIAQELEHGRPVLIRFLRPGQPVWQGPNQWLYYITLTELAGRPIQHTYTCIADRCISGWEAVVDEVCCQTLSDITIPSHWNAYNTIVPLHQWLNRHITPPVSSCQAVRTELRLEPLKNI